MFSKICVEVLSDMKKEKLYYQACEKSSSSIHLSASRALFAAREYTPYLKTYMHEVKLTCDTRELRNQL